MAKGVPQRPEDAFFLGCKELYALLANDRANSLTEAKISVRSRNFELMRSKQAKPPAHMRRGRPVVFASKSSSGDGVFRCVGTSRSRVRARAPIVTELRNIGQLTEGEILVTQSTDPGWTPVFNLLKGIVLATGGMLAHGPPQFMAEVRTTRRSNPGAP